MSLAHNEPAALRGALLRAVVGSPRSVKAAKAALLQHAYRLHQVRLDSMVHRCDRQWHR